MQTMNFIKSNYSNLEFSTYNMKYIELNLENLSLLDDKKLLEKIKGALNIKLKCKEVTAATIQQLQRIIKLLPTTVHELNLEKIKFSECTPEFVQSLFASIPEHVTALNFSNTNINEFDLAPLFRSLHKKLEVINLANNNLNSLGSENFANALKELPQSIKEINLSSNLLQRLGENGLKTVFSNLPSNLECIILNTNALGMIDSKALLVALEYLPKTVTKIVAHCNDLSVSDEALIQLHEFSQKRGLKLENNQFKADQLAIINDRVSANSLNI